MTLEELEALVSSMAPVIRTFVTEQNVPLEERLALLEVRVALLEQRPAGLKYVGTWEPTTPYTPGDVVTVGGSMWVSKTATRSRPGESDHWQLAVKAGRDGKDLR